MSKERFEVPETIIIQCVNKYKYTTDENEHIDILQEECAELIQALSKLKRGKDGAIEHVCTEMTHVMISSAIFAELHEIKQSDITSEIVKKACAVGFNTDGIDIAVIKHKELINRWMN